MKTNGDDPISANAPIQLQMTEKDELLPIYGSGLTKREYFAAMAMQGLMTARPQQANQVRGPDKITVSAVDYADALIQALNEGGEK